MAYHSEKNFSNEELKKHDVGKVIQESLNIVCCVCGHESLTYRRLKKHYRKKHEKHILMTCLFCDFVTADQFDIVRHKKVEHPDEKINCSQCGFSTRSLKKWKKHESNMHQEDILLEVQSSYLSESVAESKNLEGSSDLPSAHRSRKRKSGHLEMSIDLEEELKKHDIGKGNQESQNIVCCVCGHESLTYRRLKKHYRKKHEKHILMPCLFCDFVTADQFDMVRHKKAEHPDEKINCSQCGFSTRSLKKWKKHDSNVHQEDNLLEVQSSYLSESVAVSENLEDSSDLPSAHRSKRKSDHLEMSIDLEEGVADTSVSNAVNKKLKTSIPKTSSSNAPSPDLTSMIAKKTKATELTPNADASTVQDSVLQETSCQDNKPHRCQICKKMFTSSRSFTKHLETHEHRKLFKCRHCNYSTDVPFRFKSHKLLHADVSPFTCEFCDKKFTRKINLTYHTRIHSGEQPFSCPYCEYKTTQNTTLKQHIRGHKGSKPYTCDQCEYSTSYRSNLLYHMTSHSSDRPFPCKICDKQFKRKSHLQNHTKSWHELKI